MPETRPSPPEPRPDTAPDALLSLDNQLCFSLYASSLAMTKLYKPLLSPLGLTYPQYLVMLVLWEHGRLSVNQIGHTLHLDSGTLTPLLKRMANAGLILRQRDHADERRVLVEPTEAGRTLQHAAQDVPRTLLCRMGLSPDEVASLQDTLGKLRQRLHGLPPEPL
ncbi:MarR family transcriptional regulator [Aquabacterium olei]|uniref:MarR family transcriptional regulator n=1 Tax=Aquabacterium olei TaxID=1296669 RepID=A0A2U8FRH6_9BURK|nr:MarR family transcriptional regulator [Aquabacterium olei]AWI53671.1 MarR family transcriptional regulator [Aquabacterium olei]